MRSAFPGWPGRRSIGCLGSQHPLIEVVEEDDSSGEEAESDKNRDDEGPSLPMPKAVFTDIRYS